MTTLGDPPLTDSTAPDHPPADASGGLWLAVLTVAIAAGLVSFAIGEAAPSLLRPSSVISPELLADRNNLPVLLGLRLRRSQDLSAAMAYGSLGMLLAAGLAIAGGLDRGPGKRPAVAIVGLALGGAAGAGTTLLVLPMYHAARAAATDETANMDMALALATHGVIWAAIGAAAGAALGIGLGGGARLPRAIVGGILGGLVAAAIYEFGGALAFPSAQTFRPMAVTWPPRLLAHLAAALCISLLAYWAALHLRLDRRAPATKP
jgi:hypothetical protein